MNMYKTATMSTVSLRALLATLTWVSLAWAQNTSPQNNTGPISGNTQYTLDVTLQASISAPIAPMTDASGRGGSLTQKQMISPSGNIYLTTPSTVANFPRGNISFLSCEAEDYGGNTNGAPDLVKLVLDASPAAVILYSKYAAFCSFEPYNNIPVYSMLNTDITRSILDRLSRNSAVLPASINLNKDTANAGNPGANSVLGKSPTTAVAMIILYSITGIITALFLIIIIVGAVRAHRHPERYGPRHVIGRPRQSRAKGIARAMLDTLPIVKFGDKEDPKPADSTRDVELGSTHTPQAEQATDAAEVRKSGDGASDEEHAEGSKDVKTVPAGEGQTEAAGAQSSANPIDDGLACSVCTDDFIKGQDIRLLPCKHKFHPECIDPWLLNVSGTCPLCRIDLAPNAGDDSLDPNHVPSLDVDSNATQNNVESSDAVVTRSNRRSRIVSILNIGRMRQATPQERLEALRAVREEHNAADPSRRRFSRRFSRARSRPTSEVVSRPVSGVPPNAAGALTTMTEVPSAQEQRNTSQPPATDARREGTFSG